MRLALTIRHHYIKFCVIYKGIVCILLCVRYSLSEKYIMQPHNLKILNIVLTVIYVLVVVVVVVVLTARDLLL